MLGPLRKLKTQGVANESQSATFAQLTRELVAASGATSTTGLILLGAFVQALGGLDPCRNGRKRCRKHGFNSYIQTDGHKQHQHFFWHPRQLTFSRAFHDPLHSRSLRRLRRALHTKVLLNSSRAGRWLLAFSTQAKQSNSALGVTLMYF